MLRIGSIPHLALLLAIGLALALPGSAGASTRHDHVRASHNHSAPVRPGVRPTVIVRSTSRFSWAAALAGAAAATGTLLIIASAGWARGRRRTLIS
jgi:hypothetical protein